jgi:hydroxymethylpyrimidine/phosphomethylpyrimidine kinase
VLLIGGVDPCGGAGLTADARTAQAWNVFPATVVTCLTVQNRYGWHAATPVPAGSVVAALSALAEDLAEELPVDGDTSGDRPREGGLRAIKIGMVPGPALLAVLLRTIVSHFPGVPCVVDPVLGATAGGLQPAEGMVAAYLDALPLVGLLTPNLPELAALGGDPAALRDRGAAAVLVKDGHGSQRDVEDVLWGEGGTTSFRRPRLRPGPVHGTGCALATAIACGLARGQELSQACGEAIAWLQRCLGAMAAPPRPQGAGPRPIRILNRGC